MANKKSNGYSYTKSATTTKKMVGVYDAEAGIITVDGTEEKELLTELQDFEGAIVEISITVKDKENLADE